jgi:4-amino-4-deoxy-L-arabinose transferase-like glycosyltransferase
MCIKRTICKQERARLLVLFLLALGVRLLYIGALSPDSPIESVDAWGYHRLALNLDLGNGFSLHRTAPFIPDNVRTPLYPVILLLIRRALGPAPQTTSLIQAILDSITMLLVYGLAAQLASSRAGRIAALLYALNPTQVRYTNDLLTETTISFLLALCIYTLLRYLDTTKSRDLGRLAIINSGSGCYFAFTPRFWLGMSSLFAGLAILCKPNVQFLPAILILAVAIAHKRRWARILIDAVMMLAIIAVVLTPWIVRNYLLYSRLSLSTAFEGNVSRISAPATMAQAEMRFPVPWSEEWEGDFLTIVSETATRYNWDDKLWNALTARERDLRNRHVYLTARQVLFQHPVAWITSHLQGMLRYLEPRTYKICYAHFSGQAWPGDILDDAPLHIVRWISGGHWNKAWQVIRQERWQKLDPLQGILWWGMFGGQIIGMILAAKGAWRLRSRPAIATLLSLTVLYVLVLPGPIAYERFRVPVTSLILTLIAMNTHHSCR